MRRGFAQVSARAFYPSHVRHVSSTSTTYTSAPARLKRDYSVPNSGEGGIPRENNVEDSKGVRRFVKFVDKVVTHTEQLENLKGNKAWKRIQTRREEEMKLRQRLRKSSPKVEGKGSRKVNSYTPTSKVIEASMQSMSKQIFDSPAAVEQLEQDEIGFTPETPLGSFVEIRRNDSVETGVVIGSGFRERQWKLCVLTKEGEAWVVMKEDCYFSIPSVCPTDLAIRCGNEEKPTDDKQLNARVEVLKRLRTIYREVEVAVVGISTQLSHVYEVVRAKDPNEWGSISLSEIANIFHKNPIAYQIYATHKVMMNDTIRFVAQATYTSGRMLGVRPKADVEDLLQVQQWIREKNLAVEQFVAKTKEIMKIQKPLASETMAKPPGSRLAEHKWTATDETIIRFLKASLRHWRNVQPDPYMVPLGFILKLLYENEQIEHLDHYVHRLLVDIAVFPPWQDLIVIDRGNNLDQETRPAVLAEREQNILRAMEKSKNPNPTHSDDFYPTDPMASIRHDWGNMPVYVVDDIGAEELDDGISVERIPSEPENTWLHIHIADPTSLIPPTNFLAEKAAQQHETWYMVPKSYPLIPRCLTHHPTRGLSLGIRSKNGIPENVMTFSIKVNTKGNIIDYSVRAGLVRNVKVIDYDSVDVALKVTCPGPEYPFGNTPIRPPPQPLDPQAVEDMTLLSELAKTQERNLLSMNWFSFDRNKSRLERIEEFPSKPNSDSCQFYHGFPKLRYSVAATAMMSGSRVVIAEMMKLASRAASLFLRDRNIPALRRTSNPMVPVSEKAIQHILRTRSDRGYVEERKFLKDIIYTPAAQYSTRPGMHWGLGVPEGQGYVRVTSPLRRYGDLLAHWQIQQALLQEKEGRKVQGAFDLTWMENYAGTFGMKDQFIKTTHRRHNRFWSLLYIQRWRDLFANGMNRHLWPTDARGEPIEDPLENLYGYFVSKPVPNLLTKELQASVQVPNLGLKELVFGLTEDEKDTVELGQIVPLKLREIRLGTRPLMVFEADRSRSVESLYQ